MGLRRASRRCFFVWGWHFWLNYYRRHFTMVTSLSRIHFQELFYDKKILFTYCRMYCKQLWAQIDMFLFWFYGFPKILF
jgi:hypothetical protein